MDADQMDVDEAQAVTIRNVAAEVAALRQALLGSSKARIEDCMPRLEQATTAFQDAFQGRAVADKKAVPARFRSELEQLRRNLAVAARLAQSGAELHQGLARLLGAAAGGYTPRGDGAPLQPAVRVLVRG